MRMTRLNTPLLTNRYTEVYHEKELEFNAPHHFQVVSSEVSEEGSVAQDIKFQKGPVKENGVNGVANEDLIAMVICRLEHFNKSEFRCKENAKAITKLEESLLWLRKRTMGREQRGIEGTNKV